MQRPLTHKNRVSIFREATAIVEAEYDQPLNLDDVARRLATSRRQLQRVYQEIGDTTFREQIIEVRMRTAAQLLEGDEFTVRDIAQCVGYRQPAHFAKAFGRRYGMPPAEYRRRQRRQAAR